MPFAVFRIDTHVLHQPTPVTVWQRAVHQMREKDISMKYKMLMATLCGAAVALWAGQASASPVVPLDDLSNASTFVLLDWNTRVTQSNGGGGVSEFIVEDYAVGGELLGGADTPVYATCIEQDQYLRTQGLQWYAVFPGLENMPSATQDITFSEELLVANILAAQFGDDFTRPGAATDRDVEAVKAIQSILWEAGTGGATPADDLADGTIGSRADDAGGKVLAEQWLDAAPFSNANTVSLISLISVGLKDSALNKALAELSADDFQLVSGQDFLTYTSGGGPGIPVPAPILLTGLGLLGLYRFSRRRA
jgi:hypothetical protein